MATSAVDNFLTELRTDLAARDGLSGVTITTHPLGLDQNPLSAIQLAEVDDWRQEQMGFGSAANRREQYTIVGTLIEKGSGNTETAWTAIRTAGFAKLAEIEAQCESYIDTAATNAKNVQFAGATMTSVIVNDRDPAYQWEFRIDVDSHIT